MKRGWCPGLYDPMPSGDGLLVRVRPPGARLTAEAAHRLAAAAAAFGNGVIELTSRGKLQIRGLQREGVAGFAAAMVAAGLADADPVREARRCVLLAPLAGDDPDAAADAAVLAEGIEAALADVLLSDKFSVAVDAGGVLPLSIAADIIVRSDGVEHQVQVRGFNQTCAPDVTAALVRRLAVLAAGQPMRDVPDAAMRALLPHACRPGQSGADGIGYLPYGPDVGAFGAGVPFGQTDAAALRHLAGLAERFSGGALRVSPWRSLLFGRVRPGDAAALARAVADAGLIADPADPRRRIAACIGSDGCASGTVPARRDAASLALRPWAGTLHVAGCAKGCAHPGPADVTLVGEAGTYALIRNGRASDRPVARGPAAELLALA